MIAVKQLYRIVRRSPWMSPASFVTCACAFVGVFAVLHICGLREYTSVFCGTLPESSTAQVRTGFLAMTYTMVYMLAVLVAPILLLAAGVMHALNRSMLKPIPGRV